VFRAQPGVGTSRIRQRNILVASITFSLLLNESVLTAAASALTSFSEVLQ
jgi:hypothetical protein